MEPQRDVNSTQLLVERWSSVLAQGLRAVLPVPKMTPKFGDSLGELTELITAVVYSSERIQSTISKGTRLMEIIHLYPLPQPHGNQSLLLHALACHEATARGKCVMLQQEDEKRGPVIQFTTPSSSF